jgi:hypothetical protein
VPCGHPCACKTYREHLLSVGFAASAMPSRKGVVAGMERQEARLGKDMDAYQRLRRDGVQPHRIEGCAAVEKVATTRQMVEGGPACSST